MPYVMMPNQQGIEHLDLEDALGAQKENMCDPDLGNFVKEYHLNVSFEETLDTRRLLEAMMMQTMCTIRREPGL